MGWQYSDRVASADESPVEQETTKTGVLIFDLHSDFVDSKARDEIEQPVTVHVAIMIEVVHTPFCGSTGQTNAMRLTFPCGGA